MIGRPMSTARVFFSAAHKPRPNKGFPRRFSLPNRPISVPDEQVRRRKREQRKESRAEGTAGLRTCLAVWSFCPVFLFADRKGRFCPGCGLCHARFSAAQHEFSIARLACAGQNSGNFGPAAMVFGELLAMLLVIELSSVSVVGGLLPADGGQWRWTAAVISGLSSFCLELAETAYCLLRLLRTHTAYCIPPTLP